MEHFNLSLVRKIKGKPGRILSHLQVLGENINHAVKRAREEVRDPEVFVIQTAALKLDPFSQIGSCGRLHPKTLEALSK